MIEEGWLLLFDGGYLAHWGPVVAWFQHPISPIAVSVSVGFVVPFVGVVWCWFHGWVVKAQSIFGDVLLIGVCRIWLKLRFCFHLFYGEIGSFGDLCWIWLNLTF